MIFNASALSALFEHAEQMTLSNSVRSRLAQEGLTTVDDFADFKEDQFT